MKIKVEVKPVIIEVPDEDIGEPYNVIRAIVDRRVKEWLQSEAKVDWAFNTSIENSEVSEV